jgi:hypothetical protein
LAGGVHSQYIHASFQRDERPVEDLTSRALPKHALGVLVLAGMAAGLAVPFPAHAESHHRLFFDFEDGKKEPSIKKMKSYILGCLPNRTWIETSPRFDPGGPWLVELPKKGKTGEYSNEDVHDRLMSDGCSFVRPDQVTDVDVS